jgi:hypothetical protein
MPTLEAGRDALLDAGQDPIGALTVQPSIGDRLLDPLGAPCHQVSHKLVSAVAGQVGDAGATPQGLAQLPAIHSQELADLSTDGSTHTSRWSTTHLAHGVALAHLVAPAHGTHRTHAMALAHGTLRTHVVALAPVQPGPHLAGSLVGVLARL